MGKSSSEKLLDSINVISLLNDKTWSQILIFWFEAQCSFNNNIRFLQTPCNLHIKRSFHCVCGGAFIKKNPQIYVFLLGSNFEDDQHAVSYQRKWKENECAHEKISLTQYKATKDKWPAQAWLNVVLKSCTSK